MNDLTHCNPVYFFFPFFFHEDYHESSGFSSVHTDSRSMHVCEYVTPLFCMLNYYFNHFLGNKFLKKTQSNIETDRLYKLLNDKKNHANRDQSLTRTIYLYTITLTVKVASRSRREYCEPCDIKRHFAAHF